MNDNDQDEAISIFILNQSEYNRGIGLFQLRKKSRAMKTKSEHSLEVLIWKLNVRI